MQAQKVRKDLTEIERRDFAAFIHGAFQVLHPGEPYLDNWHIHAMAHNLHGGGNRVIISMPPRNLKSIVASVAYPAWLLGHDPSKRIICVSYAQDLADKHARQCRQVLESAWYKALFPQTRISPEKNSVSQFETTKRGVRLSTSVDGALTGFGGDVIIIDDPLKAEEAMSDSRRSAVNKWFDNSVLSRLNDKRTGRIIIVMQRLHQDDLVGHLIGNGRWSHLCLPAIAKVDETIQIGDREFHKRRAGRVLHAAREPLQVLADQILEMGSFLFSAQYQQNPLPPDGEIIKWGWFPRYDVAPSHQSADLIVQSWDTAFKGTATSDYSVCMTFLVKGNLYHLIDVLREKLDYPALKKKVIEHAVIHGADAVLVENKGSGMALVDELRRGGVTGDVMPIAVDPTASKVGRMSAESAQIEAGHVLLPKDAPWLEELRIELLQFPHGRYDDQVDALSQALFWLKTRSRSFSWDFGNQVAHARQPTLPTPPPPPAVAPTPGPVLVCFPGEKPRLWEPNKGYLD